MSKERKLFGGIDESNNGCIPEYHVLTYSKHWRNLKKSKVKMEKVRNSTKLNAILKPGVYCLVYRVTYNEKEKAKNRYKEEAHTELLSNIHATLILHATGRNPHVKILIDGAQPKKILHRLQQKLKDTGLEINSDTITSIPKADEWFPLVNSADDVASYFKRFPREYENLAKNRDPRIIPRLHKFD